MTLTIALLLAQFGGVRSIAQFRPLTSSQWGEQAKLGISGSSGCGKTAPFTGTTTRTTKLDGSALKDIENTSRQYLLQVGTAVPSGSPDSTPHPLIFGFHGLNQTSSDAQALGVCSPAAAAAGAICVFIQGVPFQGTAGGAWDDAVPTRLNYWQSNGASDGRDTLLWDVILADIEANYCIDTNKIFLEGFSFGCDIVTSMSTSRAVRAVSVASCAYAFWHTSDPTTYGGICTGNSTPCSGTDKVNPVVPSAQAPAYRFTHDPAGDSFYNLAEMTSTIAMVKAHRGCSLVVSSAGSPCTEYQWCSSRVVECTYAGLGHNPPIGWGADTWDWFNSFK